MDMKENDEIVEQIEKNFKVLEKCNQTLKKVNRIEESLSEEE